MLNSDSLPAAPSGGLVLTLDSPPCPITGEPATRLIQTVSRRMLIDLWRDVFGVDVSDDLPPTRLGLWESPAGIAFFDPVLDGSDRFYGAFYGKTKAHQFLNRKGVRRSDFAFAASRIRAGSRVLDIGAGAGGFSTYLSDKVSYVGLDPNLEKPVPGLDLRKEKLPDHVAANPGAYDAICAFQVVEHVRDPVGFARTLVEAVRPGGLVFIGVPRWPSALTELPNLVMNAPPHHLTWWTAQGLRALAGKVGLEVDEVGELPADQHLKMLYWMARLSPIKAREPYFKPSWAWHLSMALGGLAGLTLWRVLPRPDQSAPQELLLVARRPGASTPG